MDKKEIRKSSAREDLKRMRVYEQMAERGYAERVSGIGNNCRNMYKSIFGIEPHRAIQLRRIFEEASQYGNRDFEEAIREANSIPDRVPAEPYEVMLCDLREEIGQALLEKIESSESLAQQWTELQKCANNSGNTDNWEQAGKSAMQYIDAVGIDPASRDYWKKVYQEFATQKKG